jgi:hypothetical protein
MGARNWLSNHDFFRRLPKAEAIDAANAAVGDSSTFPCSYVSAQTATSWRRYMYRVHVLYADIFRPDELPQIKTNLSNPPSGVEELLPGTGDHGQSMQVFACVMF